MAVESVALRWVLAQRRSIQRSPDGLIDPAPLLPFEPAPAPEPRSEPVPDPVPELRLQPVRPDPALSSAAPGRIRRLSREPEPLLADDPQAAAGAGMNAGVQHPVACGGLPCALPITASARACSMPTAGAAPAVGTRPHAGRARRTELDGRLPLWR